MAKNRTKTTRACPVALINPVAGKGAGHDAFRHVEHALLDVLGDFEVLFTEDAGDATALTRAALAEGPRDVIVVGGDGTVNEVVNGWFDAEGAALAPGARLVLLPGGTGSDLARTLSITTTGDVVEALKQPRTRSIDVGRVSCQALIGGDRVERHFVNIASFGLSGVVNQGVARFSSMGGTVAYAAATAWSLLGWRNPEVRITYDEGGQTKTYDGRIVTAACANGRFFGGGMLVAPDADPCDGTFDLILVGDLRRRDIVRFGRLLYDGTHVEHDSVTTATATSVQVEGPEEVLLEVDGETVGRLPATISIAPGALEVLWA